jgi:mono/diheme cytochrome c family protein
MMKLGVTLFVSFLILAAISCGDSDKPANTVVNSVNTAGPAKSPMPAATIDELALGRKVYEANCVACHKENGKGGEVVIEGEKINPEDLSSAKIKGFSDEKIIRYIMNGVVDEGMPAFKDKLSEAEMRDVVKFIRVEIQGMPAKASPKADQLAN